MNGRSGFMVRMAILVLLAVPLACSDHELAPIPPRLDPLPLTPEKTILQLLWAYENKKAAEYENLFTGDYSFDFGIGDPSLQQKWQAGWFKQDEAIAARHLFQGGVNLAGETLPAATKIQITFAKTLPLDDTTAADTARFKVLSTRVDGSIEVPNPANPGSDMAFVITDEFHRFYLVRGDAAVGLSAGQPADSLHWYVRHWQDLTTTLPAKPGTSTGGGWAGIKAMYR